MLGKTSDIANSKNECRYYQFFSFKQFATGHQLLDACSHLASSIAFYSSGFSLSLTFREVFLQGLQFRFKNNFRKKLVKMNGVAKSTASLSINALLFTECDKNVRPLFWHHVTKFVYSSSTILNTKFGASCIIKALLSQQYCELLACRQKPSF